MSMERHQLLHGMLDLKTHRSILNTMQSKVAVLRQQSVRPFALAFAAFGAFGFAYFFFA